MAADKPAFDDFVAARSTALLRTAYLLTHDHALAEDLLQTALTKSWFAWNRISGSPEAYVRKVLVNTFASAWRRRWNGELATAELPERGTDDTADAVTTEHDLWTAAWIWCAVLPLLAAATVVAIRRREAGMPVAPSES